MNADVENRDEQTYAIFGAPRLEYKRLVLNLRPSA